MSLQSAFWVDYCDKIVLHIIAAIFFHFWISPLNEGQERAEKITWCIAFPSKMFFSRIHHKIKCDNCEEWLISENIITIERFEINKHRIAWITIIDRRIYIFGENWVFYFSFHFLARFENSISVKKFDTFQKINFIYLPSTYYDKNCGHFRLPAPVPGLWKKLAPLPFRYFNNPEVQYNSKSLTEIISFRKQILLKINSETI